MADRVYCFGPFRLDVRERQLLRAGQVVPLRGKLFDTLLALVENHGRLLRKPELMKAVWPDSVVEENNLDHNVSRLRRALEERRGEASYIETVPRQGYRFVAPVECFGAAPHRVAAEGSHATCLVEREAELSQLRSALERAHSGRRQVVFVTGEAGIGKTSMVRAFAEEIAGAQSARIARGDCQDRHGEGEPYMPVLEALGRLALEGDQVIDVLEKCAPSWLAQLPSLQKMRPAPQALPGVTSERMLREMAEAVELLTSRHTIILILEDLHWADYSTVDLLARIAQRTEPARLLVVGTHRPSDAKARLHPIDATANFLKLRGNCREIPLGFLSSVGVARYLQGRFGNTLPAAVAERLHARTQGNPLFMATVVDSWLSKGALRLVDGVWTLSQEIKQLPLGIPDDLRQLIENQLMEFGEADRELIEAASVAGSGFCSAAIAPALDRPAHEIEARCAALAQWGRFFSAAGAREWPDGTVCEYYSFLHSVHRDVVYQRVPAGRRVRYHQQIGIRLEQGYRERGDEIAVELAVHFREARDSQRAVRYLQGAAEQALARSAHREAVAHLNGAVEMLRRLPDMAERARRELDLLSLMAPALVATKGFADPQAEHALRRGYQLAVEIEGCATRFPLVFGLAAMLEIRGQYPKAQELMELHLPEQERRGEFLLEAWDLLACSRFHQGAFLDALEYGERGARSYSPEYHSIVSATLGEDPGIDCHAWAALALWFLGFPDRALAKARLAVSLATDPSRLYSLACARIHLAALHQLRQEEHSTLQWANEAIALATEQGYPYRRASGQVLRGWALARLGQYDEGIRELHEGIDGCSAVGAELDRPYHLALLAEAHLIAGRPAEALAALDQALALGSATPAFFYMAELHRLRGLASVQSRQPNEAAGRSFSESLEAAAAQSALSLELRAALSLAEHCRHCAGAHGSRERLAAVRAKFTEGFDTPDLRRAACFLDRPQGGAQRTA